MKRPWLAVLLAAAGAGVCWSQTGSGIVIRERGSLDWSASGSLPPGAEYHLVNEHPGSRAVELLARFKSGYVLPSHYHSHAETLVVIRGKLSIWSSTVKATLGPGSYARIPAKERHVLRAAGWRGCELFVSVDGPYDTLGLRGKD